MTYVKPDLKPLKPHIADIGSRYYQFQVYTFQSADQRRYYKVYLGIPRQINKNQPRLAIFRLDGNSVMARLDDVLLKQ
ncbi:hypothetical protein [Acinetobacter nematophilus]|uniref:hypothetical protein n=1 Tax=Acinetobacter nematophilus TaxID=2994642 RepID=UPI003AF7B777